MLIIALLRVGEYPKALTSQRGRIALVLGGYTTNEK
jgi:hypothetical protein